MNRHELEFIKQRPAAVKATEQPVDVEAELAAVKATAVEQERKRQEEKRAWDARILRDRRDHLKRVGTVHDASMYTCDPVCDVCLKDILLMMQPRHRLPY